MLLAPVVRDQKGEFRDVIERLAAKDCPAAAWRALVELASGADQAGPQQKHTIEAVVDRLVIDEKIRVRLSDSVETALRWGQGALLDAAIRCRRTSLKAGMQNAEMQNAEWGKPPVRQHQHAQSPADLPAWINYTQPQSQSRNPEDYEPLTPKHFSFLMPGRR